MMRRRLLSIPSLYDTTAEIDQKNNVLYYNNGIYGLAARQYGGTTIIYKMDDPTRVLYPAGVIPITDNVIAPNGYGCIFIFDSDKQPFNYVGERVTNSNRWAQDANETMSEYSQKWTINSPFSYIQFSVDTRYLDDAYMYDKETGQIWFAGKNTQYYGHHNISELS